MPENMRFEMWEERRKEERKALDKTGQGALDAMRAKVATNSTTAAPKLLLEGVETLELGQVHSSDAGGKKRDGR